MAHCDLFRAGVATSGSYNKTLTPFGLLEEGQELYVLAESQDRVNKERAMRRRQLKGLWQRLKKVQEMKLKRDELLKKLSAALHEYPVAARLIDTTVAPQTAALTFTLRKDKLRQTRKREGRYLLRSNITAGRTPEELWQFYIQLTEVEAAFKSLKDDLSLRPIYHQLEHRIEAHIFISFLAYCLHVTLRRRLRDLAPGLTPRSVLEKFSTIQMLDVHLPATDERTVILSHYTHPETDVQLLLQRLKLELPAQPPPKITSPKTSGESGSVVKTENTRTLIFKHLRLSTPRIRQVGLAANEIGLTSFGNPPLFPGATRSKVARGFFVTQLAVK